jgi:hypothetical protein
MLHGDRGVAALVVHAGTLAASGLRPVSAATVVSGGLPYYGRRVAPKRSLPPPSRPPAEALDAQWRWLAHEAESTDPDVRQRTIEILEEAASFESTVRRDYVGRYPLELLQNAHDAAADAGRVGRVEFVVTPTALLVANEGVPFTYERVKSLLRLGASEKAPRRERQHMIGYKGIGFSSVFEICDAPQVISQDVAFGFQPALARKQVGSMLGIAPKNVPVRPFAQRLDTDAWQEDEIAVAALFERGAVTVVRLPLRRDKSPEQIEAALQRAVTPEALLLMPAVDELAATGPNLSISWTKRRGPRRGKGRIVTLRSGRSERRAWLISESSIVVPKKLLTDLRDDSWTGIRHLKILVGLPWDRQVDGDAPAQPLHVYFPTDDSLGRALLVHGDFYVHSNRRTIETEGPGGEINTLLAERAARVAAELAASVARQGNPVLCALAPQQQASGFGRVVSERLDTQLAEARIVRASNGTLRRPTQVMRLGTSLGVRDETLLTELAGQPSDILFPGDDSGGAEALLRGLEVETIDPDDLALLLDGQRTGATYGIVASLLVRWLESLPNWERRPTIDNLRQRPVLRDTNGNWRPPRELVLRASRRLTLPAVLQREEALRPPGRYGGQLLTDLRVEVMDVANAVKSIVAMVRGGFGSSGTDAREVLRFLWSVWEATPEKLEAQRSGLRVVQVPVRSTGRGQQGWRAAQNTYFSSAWLDDKSLEQLYGPYGQSEFLAEKPPVEPRRRAQRRQFFATLGVADSPRIFTNTTYPWRWGRGIRGVRHGVEWMRDALPHIECPSSHPESMELEVQVADRLDDLIDNLSARRATALGAALARSTDPFGPSAIVRCRHGSHNGKVIERMPGYQDWLLEARAWVPVTGDPAQAALRTPATAWTELSSRDSWLTLPRATLPKSARQQLRLASPQRLSAVSLAETLDILAEAHNDPDNAPDDDRRTAQWLQERLDRFLQQRRTDAGDAPYFLCRTANKWTWATDPLIADVPGLEHLDGLRLLPAGEWRGLRTAYGLKRASDVVSIRVVAGKRVASIGLLNNECRAQILALISKQGADVERATRRLAQIRVAPVASLSLDVSLNGLNSVSSRNFHLEVLRTARRITGAHLFYVPGSTLSDAGLGREIATFLDEPRISHAIALVLRDPADALNDESVSLADVAEALRALENARKRGRGRDEEEEASLLDFDTGDEDSPEAAKERATEEVPEIGGATATATLGAASATSTDGDQPTPSHGTGAPTGVQPTQERPPKTLISDDARFGQPRMGQRRTRPQRGPRPVNAAERRGSGGFIESDPETEAKAMRIVERYGREVLGAQVFDVHQDKKGWDLEFKMADGTWQFVEVKGSSGDAAFAITRNERRAASDPEFRDRYFLYWVANAGSPTSAEIRRFQAFGLHLTDDLLDPLQWDVFDWSALPYEVIPLSENAGS